MDDSTRLLDCLRDHFHLTGAKNGCGKGDCGACTVLMEGLPIKSCLIPLKKIRGKHIQTIEGLGKEGRLHPLQIAFLEKGAVQCGFCTPGMIMASKSLLDREPHPSEEQIKGALAKNLCRCTGYQPIIEAVQMAAQMLPEYEIAQDPLALPGTGAVGKNILNRQAQEKVLGRAKFGADYSLEGMLVVGVVRSPHPYAEIVQIDLSEAEGMEGVEAVATSKDLQGTNRVGATKLKDQPILADKKVRHQGEPIVAVAARSTEVLKEALKKVKISFNLLEPIFSPQEALRASENNPIHSGGNLLYSRKIERGNLEQGFRASEIIVEDQFATAFVEHAYIEPEAGMAYKEGQVITIVCSTQDAHFCQTEISRALGMDQDKLRVLQATTGGGFGGKIDLSIQGILAVLATKTDKPLKYVYTREESFLGSPKRHPFEISLKIGATRDGHLQAVQIIILADTGAYSSWGRAVLVRGMVHATGPYQIPNVKIVGQLVYTNNPVCGAFRGFGVPQVTFALESALDMLAEKLDMDPFDIRMINAFQEGSITATGQILGKSVGVKSTLKNIKEYYWDERQKCQKVNRDNSDKKRIGVGLANMWFGVGYTGMFNPSEAVVGLKEDGRFYVYSGACDIGQGSDMVLWQIAAESLGVSLGQVILVTGDTACTPNTNITCASRQTSFSGKAIEKACVELRLILLKLVSELTEVDMEEVIWDGQGYQAGEKRISLPEIYRILKARNRPTKLGSVFVPEIKKLDEEGQGIPYTSYAFATHVAVVEVDLSTQTAKVLKIYAAHDVGKAINPRNVVGQITGGAVMGIGYALLEEYLPGITKNFKDYKIPGILDVPGKIIPIIVEEFDPLGPYGAKGLGEPAMIPTAPAIANAIYQAVGLRARHLPIKISALK